MKKVFALLLSAGVITIISCGQSAEEKAKAEQMVKDSIEQVRIQDSTTQAMAAQEAAAKDSIAKAEQDAKMQAMMDSLNSIKGQAEKATAEAKAASAKAASAKAAADKTKKQVDDQKINTTVKAGQGKGH